LFSVPNSLELFKLANCFNWQTVRFTPEAGAQKNFDYSKRVTGLLLTGLLYCNVVYP